jgi:hypothetical protein
MLAEGGSNRSGQGRACEEIARSKPRWQYVERCFPAQKQPKAFSVSIKSKRKQLHLLI